MNYTVFLTVFAGVATYVAGQFILKMIIEPVQDLKKTVARIEHTLVFRMNVIMNPGGVAEGKALEASAEFRDLSAQLHSHLYLIPVYGITRRLFALPEENSVRGAASSLIGLSNGVFRSTERIHEQNQKRIENTRDYLRIHMLDEERWDLD